MTSPVDKLIALAEEMDAKATKGPWLPIQCSSGLVLCTASASSYNLGKFDNADDGKAAAASRTAWPATALALKVAKKALELLGRETMSSNAACARHALAELDRIAEEVGK